MTDQRPIDPSTLRDGECVRADGDGWAVEGRVTFVLGDPCVDLGNYCQGIRRAVITRLSAAPEPAPIEVGDWWADEEGVPHVVEVLHDDSVGLRRWTDSVVNRFVEPSLLRDYWTRLDGPPEPPEGSIVRLGQKGNRIPFAAMRCNDVWRLTGYQEPLSWADLTSSATVDLATLQIVHTLEAE